MPYRKVRNFFRHGRRAAYIDRTEDGFFQVFRVPACGGGPEQVTSDPTHQTQPRVVTARRPDRLHRVQLPSPFLADPPVVAGPLNYPAPRPQNMRAAPRLLLAIVE